MDNDRQHRIRDRARAIWEPEGRPEARPEDHWYQAVQELDAEEAALQGGTDSALGGGRNGALGRGCGKGQRIVLGPAARRHDPGGAPGVGSTITGGGSTGGTATRTRRRLSGGSPKRHLD